MEAHIFYDKLETALGHIKQTISEVEVLKTDEFDTINYSEILNRLYNARRQTERLMVAHRYRRLSKEAFIKLSEDKGIRRVETLHTVTDFDTPHSIAGRYGMTVQELLRKNNLTTDELVAGTILKVEVSESRALNKIYEEIPTFGSQIGNLAFGTDATNELREDSAGDLQILTPEKTLAQGVRNRIITRAGDYPMEPDFGMADIVGGELPQDLSENYYKLKMVNQLEQDKRLASINELEVTREGNAIKYEGNITAINNADLEI